MLSKFEAIEWIIKNTTNSSKEKSFDAISRIMNESGYFSENYLASILLGGE